MPDILYECVKCLNKCKGVYTSTEPVKYLCAKCVPLKVRKARVKVLCETCKAHYTNGRKQCAKCHKNSVNREGSRCCTECDRKLKHNLPKAQCLGCMGLQPYKHLIYLQKLNN